MYVGGGVWSLFFPQVCLLQKLLKCRAASRSDQPGNHDDPTPEAAVLPHGLQTLALFTFFITAPPPSTAAHAEKTSACVSLHEDLKSGKLCQRRCFLSTRLWERAVTQPPPEQTCRFRGAEQSGLQVNYKRSLFWVCRAFEEPLWSALISGNTFTVCKHESTLTHMRGTRLLVMQPGCCTSGWTVKTRFLSGGLWVLHSGITIKTPPPSPCQHILLAKWSMAVLLCQNQIQRCVSLVSNFPPLGRSLSFSLRPEFLLDGVHC